jgi:hypothetical protein
MRRLGASAAGGAHGRGGAKLAWFGCGFRFRSQRRAKATSKRSAQRARFCRGLPSLAFGSLRAAFGGLPSGGEGAGHARAVTAELGGAMGMGYV